MTLQRPLADLRVLVTRPEQRANKFIGMLQNAGATAVPFPVIVVTEPLNTKSRETALKNIDAYDMAIFISPTAVEKTFEYINAFPSSLKLIALGKSTARELKVRGCQLDFEADTQDSESLLTHPKMQAPYVEKQHIVIFRGEGGRELLANTLEERGAEVTYADIYRRSLPAVKHLQTTDLNNLHAICITSNQGLDNLVALSDDMDLLKKMPLFVPGKRCATLANELGFHDIKMADSATDDSMFSALIHWAEQAS